MATAQENRLVPRIELWVQNMDVSSVQIAENHSGKKSFVIMQITKHSITVHSPNQKEKCNKTCKTCTLLKVPPQNLT